MAAEGLSVRPSAINVMLGKLRRAKPSQKEQRMLNAVLANLCGEDTGHKSSREEPEEPRIIVLKRSRTGKRRQKRFAI
jgi:hypothetical protein